MRRRDLTGAGARVRRSAPVPGCAGEGPNHSNPRVLGRAAVGGDGEAAIQVPVPPGAAGHAVYFQAVHLGSCTVSNPVEHDFP